MTNRVSDRAFRAALDELLGKKLSSMELRPEKKGKLNLFRVARPSPRLDSLVETLNCRLLPHLHVMNAEIPASAIREQRKNYEDLLPKTLRCLTADLDLRTSKARYVADLMGITDALSSDRLRAFGERVTKKPLLPDPGRQVICYGEGDFSGPHNDHHPEQKEYRKGYIDIHIMLSASSVSSQLLVYEKQRGILNEVEEVGRGLALAVYHLPFWHYVTPLISRRNDRRARRWLLLATYVIDRSKGKGRAYTEPLRSI